MFTPSDFMFTPSDFAKIVRAPEVVLILAFGAILLVCFAAAALA